ncbi:coiled-coil domain-containing protein 3a [Colossoma macropomum]|uniref:coiled-coil domain-containing protein 3a n=1 Tax=Colossoma macropomum TaxID=42526 RepID=UPI0018642737|nr:coiled-coil domain-containing protein 3a [Colossoma macropomum]
MMSARALLVLLSCSVCWVSGCLLPTEWRPLSEGCRAELAHIILYARVLALHAEPHAQHGLLYAAEVEVLCDQAWGSMLEVPAGSRLNVSGLGYLHCQSHSVMENNSYIFFLRMDEDYSILPHAINYQDAIFPDTPENRRIFSSLFQFSNCSSGHTLHSFSPEWEYQEDSRLLCSSVQQVLFEEEERVGRLEERVAELQQKNEQLKSRVGKLKRALRKARRSSRRKQRERLEPQQRLGSSHSTSPHHFNHIAPPHKPSRPTHGL